MEKSNIMETKIKGVIEELKSMNIELGNYKKFLEKVNTMNESIDIQVENLVREYQDIFNNYKELTNKESFKDMYDDGRVVDIKAYQYLMQFNKIYAEVQSLRTIQGQMERILNRKMADILENTHAYEIKRDALNMMDEDIKRRNQLTLDIISKNTEFFKEQMDSRMQIIEERQHIFQERIIDMLNNKKSDDDVRIDFSELDNNIERDARKYMDDRKKKEEQRQQKQQEQKPQEQKKYFRIDEEEEKGSKKTLKNEKEFGRIPIPESGNLLDAEFPEEDD